MINEWITNWARRTPGKTAVIQNDRSWSYRSFAEQIEKARGYFVRRGYAGSGYAVLAADNRMDFWILSLALRGLGLTTILVDNASALDGLSLPDIRCVIVPRGEQRPDIAGVCETRGLTLLSVSLDDEPSPDRSQVETTRDAGGHVLFTSGTTGKYKLVLNTPAIDAVFLRQKADVVGLTQDSVLCVFDFPAWTAAGYRWAASPWVVGGTTLIEQRRPAYRALLNPHITHAIVVPAILDSILAAPADAFVRNDAMQLAVGGGAMSHRQIEQAKARISPQLFSWLGSTEADGIAYTSLETAEDQRWHRLLPHRVVEVVSESGRPVAMGEPGRVRVGTKDGPTGYLGNARATQEYFKDGYFYPGDLAIMRSDGRLALQGRSTDVINVRGNKIYPGPIEDRLSKILEVGGVCLFSMQNESGEEEIYVVIESATPIGAQRLRMALNRALREFPRAYIRYLPSFPRNPMGKVLRRAVRDQVTAGQSRSM